MSGIRKRYDADFKAKIALEALRGERTLSEIATAHGLNPVQVTQWKRQLESDARTLFGDKRLKDSVVQSPAETISDQLYKQIGELTVEVNWLKKKSKQLGV